MVPSLVLYFQKIFVSSTFSLDMLHHGGKATLKVEAITPSRAEKLKEDASKNGKLVNATEEGFKMEFGDLLIVCDETSEKYTLVYLF